MTPSNDCHAALFAAAQAGDLDKASDALAAGANPNLHAKSRVATSMFNRNVKLSGETPLHCAAAYGEEDMIQAMLLAGADREAPNAHGEFRGRSRPRPPQVVIGPPFTAG